MTLTTSLLVFLFSISLSADSICFGTTSNGKLEKAVELPASGVNFETYSTIARTLGRTYVHSKVAEIMVNTYKSLEKSQPGKLYKYAETGFKQGGKFEPHKTHQNGLSVDHMVPVTRNGKSVHLPTHPLNKFGYNIEFDLKGNFENYKLDYESLGALIVEMHKQTIKSGFEIWRVIFDPKMTPDLLKTSHGKYLRENIQFTKKRSWVRHDEHIHVDFRIPCKPLTP